VRWRKKASAGRGLPHSKNGGFPLCVPACVRSTLWSVSPPRDSGTLRRDFPVEQSTRRYYTSIIHCRYSWRTCYDSLDRSCLTLNRSAPRERWKSSSGVHSRSSYILAGSYPKTTSTQACGCGLRIDTRGELLWTSFGCLVGGCPWRSRRIPQDIHRTRCITYTAPSPTAKTVCLSYMNPAPSLPVTERTRGSQNRHTSYRWSLCGIHSKLDRAFFPKF